MAKMKAGWMITATFDEYTKVAYFYDFNPDDGWQGTLEPALERFYHDDYPEIQDAYEVELTRFPLDCKMIGLPDNDGQVELEYHLIFDPVSFRHYFDLGWSASSSEPNERYTFERFFEDIDDDGPKEKCALVMNLEGACGEHIKFELYDSVEVANHIVAHEFKPMHSPVDGSFQGLSYGDDDTVLHYEIVKNVYDYSKK